MTLGLVLVFLIIGSGIAITALGFLLILGLTSLGIVSASVFISIYKRSVVSGFKIFMLLIFSFGGLLSGGITIYMINLITNWWPANTALIFGLSFGLLGGVALGTVSIFLIQKFSELFKKRFSLT